MLIQAEVDLCHQLQLGRLQLLRDYKQHYQELWLEQLVAVGLLRGQHQV